MTAYAAVGAVAPARGETVAVSAAAGRVGSIAAQLARRAGATVIGLASEAHHRWLEDHGVIALSLAAVSPQRVRERSGGRLDAFIDSFGSGYVEMALELGVKPERIDTIIDFEAAQRYGVKTEGSAAASRADVLAELAGMVAAGELEVLIDRTRLPTGAGARRLHRARTPQHTRQDRAAAVSCSVANPLRRRPAMLTGRATCACAVDTAWREGTTGSDIRSHTGETCTALEHTSRGWPAGRRQASGIGALEDAATVPAGEAGTQITRPAVRVGPPAGYARRR